MIPKRYGDREYICGKCGRKVGYFVITGRGDDDWGYHKDNFCQSCGEKVDWLDSKKDDFTIYVMRRYECGHFEFVRESKFIHPEEFGVTEPEFQCKILRKVCPMCEAKSMMDRAREEFERNEKVYLKYKSIQDAGKSFFTAVSDEMRESMFEMMKNEDNGE